MSYKCTAGCDCRSFREHALGITVSASALPTRSHWRAAVNEAAEKKWAKDGDAYRRLRRQGYQPPDVDGSADLEARASDPMEIADGKIYGEKLTERKVAHEVVQELAGSVS